MKAPMKCWRTRLMQPDTMILGSGNPRRRHRSAQVAEGHGGLRPREATVDLSRGEVRRHANTSRARYSLATCDYRSDRSSQRATQ